MMDTKKNSIHDATILLSCSFSSITWNDIKNSVFPFNAFKRRKFERKLYTVVVHYMINNG